MYRVKLPNGFHGERYGLVFVNGEAETENEWIAGSLKKKGVNVVEIKGKGDGDVVSGTAAVLKNTPKARKTANKAAGDRERNGPAGG